jgi:hypothetical protein
MDAMQNDSANATDVVEVTADAEGAENDQAAQDAPAAEQAAEPADGGTDPSAEPSTDPAPAAVAKAKPEDVPQPRGAEPESGSGKGKKRKSAPKSKSAAGTKSLVVFREGKVHYADETVVVLDLDDAAHPDTDVHDVVDKLSELRDAAESSGRTEAVALVAELIQAKALA